MSEIAGIGGWLMAGDLKITSPIQGNFRKGGKKLAWIGWLAGQLVMKYVLFDLRGLSAILHMVTSQRETSQMEMKEPSMKNTGSDGWPGTCPRRDSFIEALRADATSSTCKMAPSPGPVSDLPSGDLRRETGVKGPGKGRRSRQTARMAVGFSARMPV